MQAISPAQPSPLIHKLARPTTAYKLRASLAMAGLLLCVLLYFALAAWFALTACRLTLGAGHGARDEVWGWILGACAALLSVFMLKGLFFVKPGGHDDKLEITPSEQPELFRFLHRLADKAGAPRPHKVFVSARVNAAVFCDLSLLNLVLPPKKNLEIGLGLVNALTLGELRAVLAHEFGHFAQRATAVGRWVYIAQQITAHLVARRDKLDDALDSLSRADTRFAWVGWVLRLIVWSIRSLLDSAFQRVWPMQRGLAREMELNADLVAVSLAGSDALINALYRLEAADDAWSGAVGFVNSEKRRGRLAPDLFEIQSRVARHLGVLLDDPAARRVFRAELAQPPQMWSGHPSNHEREVNAKRRYIAAPIDDRPAWALFGETDALRRRVTARLFADAPAGAQPHADAPAALERQFAREFHHPRYRGVYVGRSVVRHAADLDALYAETGAPSAATLDTIYPEALAADMVRLRALEKAQTHLNGLSLRQARPCGGVILHRGEALAVNGLPRATERLERELALLRQRLQAHDRQVRKLHLAAAARLGGGWPDYLRGLLAVLHFADHTEANLRDLQGLLSNTARTFTATRKLGGKRLERTLRHGNALRDALGWVHDGAGAVRLDATLRERLGVQSWSDALGELTLGRVLRENVDEWLDSVDRWVDHTANACAALSSHALEQLLLSEAAVAAHVRAGTVPGAAPAPSGVPGDYVTLRPGAERQRQTRLDGWSRFQAADGVVPEAARRAVAGGIVAAVLGLGGTVGGASVTVYNGLALPVVVTFDHAAGVQVAPLATTTRPIAPNRVVVIETRGADGRLIERFDADANGSFGQFVYNVAGAVPLVQWTAGYGNASAPPQRLLGAPRWSGTSVRLLFVDAPRSISTTSGGGTREVLSAPGEALPAQQLALIKDPAEALRVATAHARWDTLGSAGIAEWLWLAKAAPGFKAVLAARLAESPDDVLLLRMEQDDATGAQHAAVCARHRERAAAAPDHADRQYVSVRCLPEGAEKDRAFIDGHLHFPDHGWFAYAAAYVAAGHAQWPSALVAAEQAGRRVPALTNSIAVDIARMRRLLATDGRADLAGLSQGSEALRQLLAFETGQGLGSPSMKAYAELARGQLDAALALARQEPEREARVLRLAAASDGASPALVARALALRDDQGLDENSVWAGVALAARAGRDVAAFEPMLHRAAPHARDAMLHFIAALKSGEPPEQAERLLDGVSPELRGHAYSVGTVMLGAQAPRAWRDGAKRLLFASERPFFG